LDLTTDTEYVANLAKCHFTTDIIGYGDSAGNTFEENSSIFSLIRMR